MVLKQKVAKVGSGAIVVRAAKGQESIHLTRSVLSIRIGLAERVETLRCLAKVGTIQSRSWLQIQLIVMPYLHL
jgi:uncharacterized protein YfaQ (DUF2300 family)